MNKPHLSDFVKSSGWKFNDYLHCIGVVIVWLLVSGIAYIVLTWIV